LQLFTLSLQARTRKNPRKRERKERRKDWKRIEIRAREALAPPQGSL
jgi:hypothetical protein